MSIFLNEFFIISSSLTITLSNREREQRLYRSERSQTIARAAGRVSLGSTTISLAPLSRATEKGSPLYSSGLLIVTLFPHIMMHLGNLVVGDGIRTTGDNACRDAGPYRNGQLSARWASPDN